MNYNLYDLHYCFDQFGNESLSGAKEVMVIVPEDPTETAMTAMVSIAVIKL